MKALIKKCSLLFLLVAIILSFMPTITKNNIYATTYGLDNPRITTDKIEWDCIYFGSYPQTEIVSEKSQCGTTGKTWEKSADCIVNSTLYNQLKNSISWDANNVCQVEGNKYKRIKFDDATWGEIDGSEDYHEADYYWSDSVTYHYFKFEPIKWRVLNVNGNNAFLMADKGIDSQMYNETDISVTWETCSLRNWLNGAFLDYFTSAEANAVYITSIENADNLSYKTEGGNNTNDKIYLLSESEVYYTDISASYGFVKDRFSDTQQRRAETSTYAKAMGTESFIDSDNKTTSDWWLRSPGDNSYNASYVASNGCIGCGAVDLPMISVRPALHINLDANVWSIADSVSSTVKEIHNHSFYHATPIAATETTDGNYEYWYCNICGKYFKDEEGNEEYLNTSWKIPKIGGGTTGGGGAAGGGSNSGNQDADKESNSTIAATATDAKGNAVQLYSKIDSSRVKTDKAIISITGSSSTELSNLSLDVPKELVADVVSNGTRLEISTPIDTITLDAKALTSIGDGDFTVAVGTKYNKDDINKATQADYYFTLKKGSKMVTNFGKGTAEVMLPIPGGLSSKSDVKVLYDDGKFFTDMNGIVSGSKITFQTNHFSKYSIMDASSAKTKLIKSVKSSTIGTPKLSAKKKKITLTWKNGKGNTPSKYYIYRSLKKTKGFSKIATIKNTSKKYTDSKKLKKGKTYYYKVVGAVNVDNKWYNTISSAIKGIKCK